MLLIYNNKIILKKTFGEYMNKKLAKRNFICISIITAILIALCFVNFLIPATNYRFVGFANAITTDLDISGGYSASYEVVFPEELTNKSEKLEQTARFLTERLRSYGYGSVRVSVSQTNESAILDKLLIEVPKYLYAQNILNAVPTSGGLYIRTTETTTVADTDITGEDIEDVYSTFSQISASEYKWGTTIKFSETGQTKIENLTTSGSGTIYIYAGEELVNSISFSQKITGDSLYTYSTGSSTSQDTANVYAFSLLMANQEISFEMIGDQITTISPILGESSLLLIAVALAIIIALFVLAVVLLFGDFGWIITLSLAIYFALILFFMQAMPIFILSLGGIVGSIFALLLLGANYYVIFGNIKKGYAEGKKIPLAVKAGYNKSILTVVDMNVLAFIFAIIIYFIGSPFTCGFALALSIGSVLNLFASLVLTKWFTKWYLSFNSTKANKLRMKREASINELK